MHMPVLAIASGERLLCVGACPSTVGQARGAAVLVGNLLQACRRNFDLIGLVGLGSRLVGKPAFK